jgi:ABC-type glutathione transport system ATPase component
MLPLVAISNLTVSFGETRVLHGVDFSICKGQALGLVGESGSGKSVTACRARPAAQFGESRWEGRPEGKISWARRRIRWTACAAAVLR